MTGGAGTSDTVETLILGAGLAGLSAAWHVGGDCIVAEAATRPGGTAATLSRGPFLLDRGVHVLYFRDSSIRDWIVRDVGVSLVAQQRRSAVWFGGKFVPFPLQFNLASLPLSSRIPIIATALRAVACSRSRSDSSNLARWANANYGQALTQKFLAPYNEKVWGVPFDQLTGEWMGGYVPAPSVRRMLRGSIANPRNQVGANATFYYPESGGIGQLAESLARGVANIRYGKTLQSLDYRQRAARFLDGSEVRYHRLVNTLPLSDVVSMLLPPDPALIERNRELRSNPVTIAHVLIPRPGVGAGLHWLYAAQPAIPFYRISFPHHISPANCSNGWSAITAEIGGEVQDLGRTEQAIKRSLHEMGLLRTSEMNAEVAWDFLRFGYVTYDRSRSEARYQILRFLSDNGIVTLGRYGRWDYSNMELALIQGRAVSRRLGRSVPRLARQTPIPRTAAPNNLQQYFVAKYPSRESRMSRLVYRRGENARFRVLRRWVPQWEGLSVLDAGCGDGDFLARLLHGRPALIRLEDIVPDNVQKAYQRLRYFASEAEAITTDVRMTPDDRRYDVVLAIGLFDYYRDWSDLLQALRDRSAGVVIADFPKRGKLHNAMRKSWLRAHGVSFRSAKRSDLESLLCDCGNNAAIEELPLQWMVRIETQQTEGQVRH